MGSSLGLDSTLRFDTDKTHRQKGSIKGCITKTQDAEKKYYKTKYFLQFLRTQTY